MLWAASAGVRLWIDQDKHQLFLNEFLIDLALYHSSARAKGIVWQYGYPQFNNYQFKAPMTSTRLMLEIKPGLLTWKDLSPYPILSLGISLNNMSYHEKVIGVGVDPNSYHYLGNKTNTNESSNRTQ